jgi:hypothetical protein
MLVLGALLVTGGVAIGVAAQQRPQVIDIAKVSDNYYVLTSSTPGNADSFSGGNVGVFLTSAGVVLVDTKLAAWGDTFLSRVRSISDASERVKVAVQDIYAELDAGGSANR